MHPVGRSKQPIVTESPAPILPPPGSLDRFHASTIYGASEEQIEYLVLLRRHRFAILSILLFCLLCGVLYARFAPKSYQVETVLEITGVNENFLNFHDVDPSAGGIAPDSYLETQIKLLQNESVVDRVVEAMAPTVPPSLAADEEAREQLIGKMLRGTKAKEEGQSKLVRITMNGPDPQLVTNTANELIRQYIQQGEEARLSAASQTGVFLQKQLEDAKNKLQKSEDTLQDYARASGIVLTNDAHETISADHLRQIQQGLAQAELDRASRQSQMEMARNADVDSVPQILDDPTIREERIRLTDLRRQLAELSTTMTPSNYRVQKIQAQIQDVEAEMKRHRSMILNRLAVEDRTAARREQLLQKEYAQQLVVVTDEGSKQVRFNMLKHDVDVNLQIYQSMLQRAKEAGVMAALRAADARVVSAAKVPFLPYSPKLSICLLLSTLAGTMFSILYILICERRDNSVRNPGESERYIERPELAVIPRVRQIDKPSKGSLKLAINRGNGSRNLHPILEHWKEADKTFLAEAYRSAGASILFSRNGPVPPKVLLVTSPHPQCGKTTTTANLAVSLAEGGKNVLVIDGDLRRPALAQIFGVQNGEGLVNTLDEGERADPYSLIRSTTFSGVRILAGGSVKVSIAKLLHSSRLGLVIDELRDEFDFILIDAPPLLGLADARILGKFSDGVILVCRAGHTSVDDLEETRRLLVEDGTHILGTILNGYDLQRERSAHYNSYLKYIGKTLT